MGGIDQLVTQICADKEKDFLNAYSGQMGMIMRELNAFKMKINNEKLELKKNTKIRSLQSEVEYFQNEALHYRELDAEQNKHIKAVHHLNEGLRDDTYVLR